MVSKFLAMFDFIPPGTRHPRAIFQWLCRDFRLQKQRKLLKNTNFSIISNNCLGAMITHDLLQPQLSPTVNLFIKPYDFIKFLKNIKTFVGADIIESETEAKYPVGLLNGREGTQLHFMHYNSFESAVEAWKRRSSRINFDNLLVLLQERDGCSYDCLKEFDNLPFKNKVAIVHKPYPEIKSAVVIPGFETDKEVGVITDWKNVFGLRVYDAIDWVSIINSMK